MTEDLLKQLVAVGVGIITALVGALCAVFVPLLHRTRRNLNEIEIKTKEIEYLEKITSLSNKFKSEHDIKINITAVADRFRALISHIDSDPKLSAVIIKKYLQRTSDPIRWLMTPLPKFDDEGYLSFSMNIYRYYPIVSTFASVVLVPPARYLMGKEISLTFLCYFVFALIVQYLFGIAFSRYVGRRLLRRQFTRLRQVSA